MKINRRQFLAGLAGLGAAVILPENATASQVNAAWRRLLADPWYFDVGEFGTIIAPGIPDPQTRADVWESISTTGMEETSDLISTVEHCEALAERFRSLASDEREAIRSLLNDEGRVASMWPLERQRLKRLAKALEDEDYGWRDWIRIGGQIKLPQFLDVARSWLNEPVDWDEFEWFPRYFGGQGKALEFFQQTAAGVAAELGVVTIEGAHPGSTYFAAELRNSVEDANEVAERLGLPFRFRAAA